MFLKGCCFSSFNLIEDRISVLYFDRGEIEINCLIKDYEDLVVTKESLAKYLGRKVCSYETSNNTHVITFVTSKGVCDMVLTLNELSDDGFLIFGFT